MPYFDPLPIDIARYSVSSCDVGFEVFVASPTKSRPVHMILYQNRDKLISFLQSFQTDRSEDTQFNDEKQYLIKQIRELQPLAPP
nr:calcium binding protein 39 [Hymenolepis microstoma]